MGLRILIVEDDAVLADGISSALRKYGYVVDCLADGAHADQAHGAQVRLGNPAAGSGTRIQITFPRT